MNKLCVGWMTVAIVLGVAPSVSLAKNTHDGLTKILSTYVHDGATNFTELCKDDHLTGYIEQFNATDPEAIKDTNDRFAFWLNVYNAYSLQAICQKYPIKSVNDLNPGGLILSVVLKKSVWDKPLVMVNHKQYSLKQVDHEILRTTFKDPRIPFAIACGGIGCGPSRSEAYEGSTIDSQLEDQTRIFINDIMLNSFDVNTKTAVLSPLFKFSAKDFGKNQAELLVFIAKYLPVEIAQDIRKSASQWKVKYNSYDLTLNDTRNMPAQINERLVKEVMPKDL